MSGTKFRIAVVCLSHALASSAWAQNQPWSTPNGAVESIVNNCADHVPYPRVAMDDFQYTANTNFNWIRWWGVVTNAVQLDKPYYIAIWSTGTVGPCPAPCKTGVVLQSWCLTPSHRTAGTDCQNRTVYRFQVSLPAPGFTALANTKYWLQISEIDDNSFLRFATDFWWSGYRDLKLCDAQQRTAAGVVSCTIFDDCPNPKRTDLAYVLGLALGGVIAPPAALLPPIVFLAEIRPAGADPFGPPMSVACVEPDTNGQYFLDHGLPDGQYKVSLIGMGAPRPTRAVTIQGGVGQCDFFDIFTGDLNNDGRADGLDTQLLVNGLLHP